MDLTLSDQIQQAEQQLLLQARLAGNADTLDRLLADESNFVGPDGKRTAKEMDLATHRSGIVYLTSLAADKPTVQLLPNLALVTVLVNL